MLFEMARNVGLVIGCALGLPILIGFVVGFVEGVRTKPRPTLRVFVGE